MANYSGEDARLQIGKETTWGTAVAPTVELDMLSEDFGEEMIVKSEETLVGKAVMGRTDIMGKKVPGGFSMLVKPDNIGLILACALGTEAAASSEGSGVYSHDFTLLTGSAAALPHFTAVVDKKTSVYGYVSNKINSLSFDLANNDYLKATVTTVGRNEAADSVESLTLSTLRAFNFNDVIVSIEGSPITEIRSVKINFSNNLEDDLFVTDGSQYMIEPDRQRREVTVELDALWSDTVETLRETYYKTSTAFEVEIAFTGELAATGLYYSLTFALPNCYFTTAKPVIGGPERITLPLSLRAAAIGADEPVTVTLQDKRSTKYTA